ncbi:hypothetical protein SS50377_22363 [Spironucleus salmonicida]|uniref:Uncharacterized protein n=1 Tax=Spironucleus salmonicida TaxID=348837 RepID=V6LCE3_9EUKA|nr:hypothetical protein SS50377_22363 [Spironucleus salmonicida]|eukprot:EST42142.1 Hypothetical protein SS50377_18450 [Spironucleus salmonicida]
MSYIYPPFCEYCPKPSHNDMITVRPVLYRQSVYRRNQQFLQCDVPKHLREYNQNLHKSSVNVSWQGTEGWDFTQRDRQTFRKMQK